MNAMLTNWRTSAAGLILLGLGVFELLTGIHIPGFSMEPGAAIAAGVLGLIAKDPGVK